MISLFLVGVGHGLVSLRSGLGGCANGPTEHDVETVPERPVLDCRIDIESGDQPVGGSPVAVHLVDGETATVVVSHKGYKTKSVTIDGGDAKVTVTLDSMFGPPPRGAGGGSKPAGGGIDDVGDPFAKKR